mmetsp:Transcript_7145/g.12825  ORF Transcript_7145/g.12825 Transcript_7145/m.12825 type:complete len:92 (-) Transcript_7145:108-383(-)
MELSEDCRGLTIVNLAILSLGLIGEDRNGMFVENVLLSFFATANVGGDENALAIEDKVNSRIKRKHNRFGPIDLLEAEEGFIGPCCDGMRN